MTSVATAVAVKKKSKSSWVLYMYVDTWKKKLNLNVKKY